MRLLADLQRVLPYDVVRISKENYAIARDVYFTNPGYFALFDAVPDDNSILRTVGKVPDGFDAKDKLFAAICEDGHTVAIIDLLAGYPDADKLWLGLFLVRGDLHGGGIGASIISHVVKVVRDAGFDSIHLGVHKDNDGAMRFWKRMSFDHERESGDFLVYQRSLHESI